MPNHQAFIHVPREKLPQRAPELRRRDWDYIGEAPAASRATAPKQASRCMDCGVPFCQSSYGCPVENLIPDWNGLVAAGQWQKALASLHATNNFPEFTGFLCPAPCESACVLNRDEAPVAIRDIELQIIDHGFAAGWVQAQPPRFERPSSVAVVGSGPAGLAAAQQLRRLGYSVTVYERAAKPGGLLRYGIPDFKMSKDVLDRRLEQLRAEGIAFRCSVAIGSDETLAALRSRYDAVCLAIGAEQSRDLPVPGRHLHGVIQAMPYLTEQNQVLSGELTAVRSDAKGKRVAVIGGGDTGADCIATALRQGATQVYEFCWTEEPPSKRSAATPWPQWPLVLKKSYAHEEGCDRIWNAAATHLSGSDQGQVTHIHIAPAAPGAGGAPLPQEPLAVDLVILAIGFTGIPAAFLAAHPELRLKANGALAVDAAGMTSVPGVFAAGDATRGASLIVWAIAEGRKIAAQIDRYLTRAQGA